DLAPRLARAGEVGDAEPLRDHAVQARRLEAREPLLRPVAVPRRRREPEALGLPLELAPALLERVLPDLLALPEKQVEGDEVGGDLRGKPAHARLCRMEAELHRVE